MLDHYNRDSLAANFFYHLDDFFDLDVIEAGHDFVEQQKLRPHGERLCDLQPFAVGTAKTVGALLRSSRQPDKVEPVLRLLLSIREFTSAIRRAEEGSHCHIIEHCEARERTHDLKGARDAQKSAAIRR